MQTEPFPALATPRLTLRCVAARDAMATARLMSPGISRWLATWPAPLSVDLARTRIDGARLWAEERMAMPVAIVERASGDLLGWVSIGRDPQRGTRAILGYWIGEAHQGQGFMREAVGPCLDAAFAFLDVTHIAAAVQKANIASLAVARRLGMRQTGESLIHAPSRGQDEDCFTFELSRQGAFPA